METTDYVSMLDAIPEEMSFAAGRGRGKSWPLLVMRGLEGIG